MLPTSIAVAIAGICSSDSDKLLHLEWAQIAEKLRVPYAQIRRLPLAILERECQDEKSRTA
jgi:hypothetical protein